MNKSTTQFTFFFEQIIICNQPIVYNYRHSVGQEIPRGYRSLQRQMSLDSVGFSLLYVSN
jgi:hypothetical protein